MRETLQWIASLSEVVAETEKEGDVVFWVLLISSSVGGFFSGLLGVGGAVLLIPLLLSVPRLVGVDPLSMHEVAAITMLQILIASFFGAIAHYRNGNIDRPTLLRLGIPMGIFSLLGSTLSRNLSEGLMLSLFGILVLIALFMMLSKPPKEIRRHARSGLARSTDLVSTGSLVGLSSGIVGAGGGFILVPVMVRVFRIPIQTAVGTGLGIVFIGALMGAVGKIATWQVPWSYLLPVAVGALPTALLGAAVNRRIPARAIRWLLILLILAVLVQTWGDILTGLAS